MEKTITKLLRRANRIIDKQNSKLATEKREKEIEKIKLETMRQHGKCEAYIEMLTMIKKEV